MHAAVFFSLFGVQTDPKIVGTGRWVFPSANSPRSFFSELEIHQKEGSPFGGQGRQDPTVAIPESPRLSLFDDYGVASDSEFVNVSPALELRGLPEIPALVVLLGASLEPKESGKVTHRYESRSILMVYLRVCFSVQKQTVKTVGLLVLP